MPHDDYSRAKHHLSSAINAEAKNLHNQATESYKNAIRYFSAVLQTSKDADILAKASQFRTNAEERIAFISKQTNLPEPGKSTRGLPTKETLMKVLKNVTDAAVDRILKEVLEDCSSVSLMDVAGNDRAKQILNEAVILPTLRPELFTGLRAPVRGVLLFGPPGNGKTMLAKAIACESNCVFFNISAASLLSKWVGESENMVRALFAVARRVQPAIIFLDEVDSLMTARKSDSGHEVTRRVLTQLLAEMDGVGSGSERLLILAATNRPQELDEAALRRFPRRVYVHMLDANARADLLRKLLSVNTRHSVTDKDLRMIASQTNGYSASDLSELAKEAALQPIREIDSSMLRTIPIQNIRPIGLQDFLQSLKSVRPSVSPVSLSLYEQWNKQYGDTMTDENGRHRLPKPLTAMSSLMGLM